MCEWLLRVIFSLNSRITFASVESGMYRGTVLYAATGSPKQQQQQRASVVPKNHSRAIVAGSAAGAYVV